MMINNTTINENRNNLIAMMAICEDITRSNHRIHELLRTLMSNPDAGKESIETSVEDLLNKVEKLKNVKLGVPLIEEENVVVPGPEDVSLKEDPDYKELVQTPPEPEEDVVEEETYDETAEEFEEEEYYDEEIKEKQFPPKKQPRRKSRKKPQKRVAYQQPPVDNTRQKLPRQQKRPLRTKRTSN